MLITPARDAATAPEDVRETAPSSFGAGQPKRKLRVADVKEASSALRLVALFCPARETESMSCKRGTNCATALHCRTSIVNRTWI